EQRSIQPMALDDAQKARFVAYLKRFADKAIIKYADLTPLWNSKHREPFPKSFPYHVLNQAHLSSFHGFEFRLAARADYLQAMPVTYKDGSWRLTPNWELIENEGADFVIAYEA